MGDAVSGLAKTGWMISAGTTGKDLGGYGFLKRGGALNPIQAPGPGTILNAAPDATDAMVRARRRAVLGSLVGKGVGNTLSQGDTAVSYGQPLKTLLGS
jgi:hypothetical protein